MAERKQDHSPTILRFFRLASPKENVGSSSEGTKSAESKTRPTSKTAVIDGWVKGWSLLNTLHLEAGYGPEFLVLQIQIIQFVHLFAQSKFLSAQRIE